MSSGINSAVMKTLCDAMAVAGDQTATGDLCPKREPEEDFCPKRDRSHLMVHQTPEQAARPIPPDDPDEQMMGCVRNGDDHPWIKRSRTDSPSPGPSSYFDRTDISLGATTGCWDITSTSSAQQQLSAWGSQSVPTLPHTYTEGGDIPVTSIPTIVPQPAFHHSQPYGTPLVEYQQLSTPSHGFGTGVSNFSCTATTVSLNTSRPSGALATQSPLDDRAFMSTAVHVVSPIMQLQSAQPDYSTVGFDPSIPLRCIHPRHRQCFKIETSILVGLFGYKWDNEEIPMHWYATNMLKKYDNSVSPDNTGGHVYDRHRLARLATLVTVEDNRFAHIAQQARTQGGIGPLGEEPITYITALLLYTAVRHVAWRAPQGFQALEDVWVALRNLGSSLINLSGLDIPVRCRTSSVIELEMHLLIATYLLPEEQGLHAMSYYLAHFPDVNPAGLSHQQLPTPQIVFSIENYHDTPFGFVWEYVEDDEEYGIVEGFYPWEDDDTPPSTGLVNASRIKAHSLVVQNKAMEIMRLPDGGYLALPDLDFLASTPSPTEPSSTESSPTASAVSYASESEIGEEELPVASNVRSQKLAASAGWQVALISRLKNWAESNAYRLRHEPDESRHHEGPDGRPISPNLAACYGDPPNAEDIQHSSIPSVGQPLQSVFGSHYNPTWHHEGPGWRPTSPIYTACFGDPPNAEDIQHSATTSVDQPLQTDFGSHYNPAFNALGFAETTSDSMETTPETDDDDQIELVQGHGRIEALASWLGFHHPGRTNVRPDRELSASESDGSDSLGDTTAASTDIGPAHPTLEPTEHTPGLIREATPPSPIIPLIIDEVYLHNLWFPRRPVVRDSPEIEGDNESVDYEHYDEDDESESANEYMGF